jgi:hypothetical protein
MKTPAKIELALIPVVVAGVGIAGGKLPTSVGFGELLVIVCLGWLVQGGIRDLWFLYRLKSHPPSTSPRRMACMCLESSAGLTGIVLGVALALTGLGGRVALSPARWAALAFAVLTLGFLLRDVIITWRPLGLRRDPDHHAIIFAWK